MHAVLSTSVFARQAKALGLRPEEWLDIEAALSADPLMGDVIVGTSGARKVRFPGRGKGKSGGYRTIHYFGGEDVPVFLLAIYGKGDKADLSQEEKNTLAALLPAIADQYRAGVIARTREERR